MFSNIFYDAKAHIQGSKDFPGIDGYVYFNETKDGILMTAKINGLPYSNEKCKIGSFFGFHIHERNIMHRK